VGAGPGVGGQGRWGGPAFMDTNAAGMRREPFCGKTRGAAGRTPPGRGRARTSNTLPPLERRPGRGRGSRAGRQGDCRVRLKPPGGQRQAFRATHSRQKERRRQSLLTLIFIFNTLFRVARPPCSRSVLLPDRKQRLVFLSGIAPRPETARSCSHPGPSPGRTRRPAHVTPAPWTKMSGHRPELHTKLLQPTARHATLPSPRRQAAPDTAATRAARRPRGGRP